MKNQFSFSGKGSEFFGIWIVNLLLSIVTLGIYSAWAKVRTKQYFYSHTTLASDSFEYHALPIQILKGRIIATIAVVLWAVSGDIHPFLSMALLLAFYVIYPLLIRNNLRFDARMTSYRNVRFNFEGSLGGAYIALLGRPLLAWGIAGVGFVVAGFLMSFSYIAAGLMGLAAFIILVLAGGWAYAKMIEYFARGYRFGLRRFTAELESSFYAKTMVLAWLIILLSSLAVSAIGFGVIGFGSLEEMFHNPYFFQQEMGARVMVMLSVGFYAAMLLSFLIAGAFVKARTRNYVFSRLQVEDEPEYQFASELTVMSMVWLMVSNFLLTLITVGFARPWVMVRTTRYVVTRTTVIGPLDSLSVEGQEFDSQSALGDEMAEAFDLGAGIV